MKVLILMGSDSDVPVMEGASSVLEEYGITYKMTVASAHRTPERVRELVREAEKKGANTIICGAGMAAHLAGAVAAETLLPVIGVPINASTLNGLDALLSTVQMPPGIPVATVSIGKAGAKNAGHLAAQIVAQADKTVAKKLKTIRRNMAKDVEKKALALEKKMSEKK
jgi:phosphoribosylaminoimidazole carboxylase PurE protein